MRDFHDAKAIATTIRDELAAKGVQLGRAESLEITAKALGAADWNTLSARIKAQAGKAGSEDDNGPDETVQQLLRPFYQRHGLNTRIGAWARLFREAQTLYEAGADPGSDAVLDLARRWHALSYLTDGGDPQLRAKYAAAYREALDDPQIAPKLPLSRELLAWFAPALKRVEVEARPSTPQPDG
jgi:hypothetical protein